MSKNLDNVNEENINKKDIDVENIDNKDTEKENNEVNNDTSFEFEFLEDVDYRKKDEDIRELDNDINIFDEKQVSKSSKASKRKIEEANRRKSKKRFKLALLIYTFVLTVIIIGVWIFFYSFIDWYEKGMSYNKIAEVAETLDETKVDELFASVQSPNEFESADYIFSYIKELIKGKNVTYKEAKETTTNIPVYELLVDNKPFAKVTLVQNGTIKHGFKNWEVQSVSVDGYIPETTDITILTREETKVYINGKEVSDSYITEKEIEVAALKNVAQYLEEVPTEDKYEIKGFFEKPEIVVKDSDGNVVDIVENENVYEASYTPDSATEEEFKSYVEDVTYAYARNFANLGKNIYNYIRPNSELYAAVESATTYFYPDSKISGTEFTSREITDFVRYSDDCFTCHVNYVYTIHFVNYSTDKDEQKVDMIWTFVRYNGLWYLTETKYIN